jgi:hypothetical protein
MFESLIIATTLEKLRLVEISGKVE